MKKTLMAMVAATLCATPAIAKTDLNVLSDELNIMKSIMQTAMRQNNDRKGIRVRSIDATYLAGQGILFEVGTSGSGWQFNIDLGNIISDLSVPVAPIPPVQILGNEQEFVIMADEQEWAEIAEEAMEDARDALRETSSRLRELREREREYAWEQREYERRKRDLEFERRNADKERRDEIEARSKELEKELAELKKQQEEVSSYAREIEKEQKEQAEKRNAAREKQYKLFLANFEDNVGDVLCKYGAGIKSMPGDEHVTFVLPKMGKDERGNTSKDRIYVFRNSDIQSCVRDGIDVAGLLSKANTYSF